MNGGRKGMFIKWAAGIAGALSVGGGNVLGVIAQRLAAGGLNAGDALLMRWCVTGFVWLIGIALAAVVYQLGAALERIDTLEMWILSLDTAVRNRDQE